MCSKQTKMWSALPKTQHSLAHTSVLNIDTEKEATELNQTPATLLYTYEVLFVLHSVCVWE